MKARKPARPEYAPGDLRRADAFQIFYLFFFISAILSPLVCGTLGQRVAWHWGFGAAGIGMLFGLGVYLSGRRWLPKASAGKAVEPSKLSRRDVKTVLVLVSLLPTMALSALGNQQIFNAYIVWGEAHYNLTFFGRALPVTWLLFGGLVDLRRRPRRCRGLLAALEAPLERAR